MKPSTPVDRRLVMAGLAASAAATALPLGWLADSAVAQTAAGGDVWRDLADLAQEAQRLGLSVPRMSLSASAGGGGFDETMPAVVDFMDNIAASAADARGVTSTEVDAILERASDILRAARNGERMPRDVAGEGEMRAAPLVKPPEFATIAEDYRKLFQSCRITDAKRSEVAWYVSKIVEPERRKSYEQVYEETCVPWFFVAITHGMEASFDTKSHLHNGDPLKDKTVQVPAGRPDPWKPPADWVSSATDAMKYDKFHEKPDWDLATCLYRWEAYNGWRSRTLHSINTPYLWSFSNHYTKGKFVADGVWDANAVSKQCGAAVMLKAMVEAGHIAPPA